MLMVQASNKYKTTIKTGTFNAPSRKQQNLSSWVTDLEAQEADGEESQIQEDGKGLC